MPTASFPVGILILLAACLWFLARLFYDPLRHIPGPSSARWSHLPMKYRILRGEKSAYIHNLHEKYGPIVRLGPSEVSTVDLPAVRTIYKVGSPFPKSNWYVRFTYVPKIASIPLFSMVDSKQHAKHRRVQAHNFSEKWIKAMEPQVVRNVGMTVSGMKRESETQGYVDVLKWFTFMATDVIGEASFGESFKLLESGEKNQYFEDLEGIAAQGVLKAELPLAVSLFSWLPFGPAVEAEKGGRRLAMYGLQSLARYKKQLELEPDNVKPTLLTNEYRLVDDGSLPEGQLLRDAMGIIVAGTDTTSVTATYLTWSLARHPAIQAQVIAEVEKLPMDCTDDDIRKVELFSHVMNETLRLYGAASGSMPRMVPAGGITICGHYIPGGTEISTQSYSMHRLEDVWENVDSFDPSRWESPSREMKDAFMPWGGGSRACLGMHFAQVEIRRAIVDFYRTFPKGVEPSFDDGFSSVEMEQESFFLVRPKGRRCLLRPL